MTVAELAARAKHRTPPVRYFDGEYWVTIWWDADGHQHIDVEDPAAAEDVGYWPLRLADPAHQPKFPPAWWESRWPRRFPPDRTPAVWLTTELGVRAARWAWRENGGWWPLHGRTPEQQTPWGRTKEEKAA